MRLLAIAIALFLVPQDEKITLKFQPRKGDKVVRTHKMDLHLKMEVEMGENIQDMEFEQRGSSKSTFEFVEVEDGKLSRVIVDCAESYEEKKQPPTMEWSRTDSAMHGRKVTVFMKDGQLVREGAEGLKESDLKGLSLTAPEARLFPDKPVAVGESWDVAGEAVKEFIGTQNAIKEASIKFKLKEVKEIDKRRCAVITGALEMKGTGENEVTFSAKMDMDVVVWIERGYLLSAKGRGKVTLKADTEQFKVTGDGPINIETTVKVD